MLNTRDLERRWLKYKIRSFLPYGVITLSSIIIISSVYFYFSSNDNKESASVAIKNPVLLEQNNTTIISAPAIQEQKQPVPTISSVIDTKIVSVEQQENKKIVLKPSLDFMKKIQESSNGYYQSTPEEEVFDTSYAKSKADRTAAAKKKTQQNIEVEDVEIEETPAPVAQKNTKIIIAKQTSLQDIKDAEKRFKENNSPALSLFLAKQYYALENYSQSYNYALVTNQLDKTNEDSWLIFSRSLVKLGKTDLAKKALREYIKFSHSSNAALLLDDITTGKFQ